MYVRENGKVREKEVLPHYLKEDQYRWYLLAYEENVLKTFSVDCVIDPQDIVWKNIQA